MSSAVLTQLERAATTDEVLDAHVVYLATYIPPHALPVYVELAKRVRKFTILLSTPMELHRHWKPEFADLDVRVQRTWTFARMWKHPVGFQEKIFLHIPWNTVNMLRELQPDVVLSEEFGARSFLGAIYSLFWRRPLVLVETLSEHQELGRGLVRYFLRRWLIRRSTTIAVNGQSGARYLKKMGAEPEQIHQVPYIHVPNYFENICPERTPELAHRLLYVGQLVERKGLRPFLESLSKWATSHPDRVVEFDLVGSGLLEAELRAFQVPSNVKLRFLGERPFSELVDCYANAGILVFPTLSDEWGLVTNEALAAGLPVLGSTYAQSVEELVIEGETGWLFRPNEPAEMEAAIDRALGTSYEELERMREAGHKLVSILTPAFGAEQFLVAIKAALPATRTS